MDTGAARRARRRAIKRDLTEAYTDEEASPPEWVDLLAQVRDGTAELRELISKETDRFVADPDIRTALTRRDRVASDVRARVVDINRKVARLNLIAPHARFTRAALDADQLLRPLYRSKRT
jgi:hypothetical protein